MAFGHMTQEERQANLAKARDSRVATSLEREANEHNYKLTYLDSSYWQDLATKYKVRMPSYNEPASVRGIRKYLKRCKVDNTTWTEAYGNVGDWVVRNPTWTLYGAIGTMLELRDAS